MDNTPLTEGALMRSAAYLLLEDADFLRAFHGVLKPEHFVAPELRQLVSFALTFYGQHRQAPSLKAFALEVESPPRSWVASGLRPEMMDALVAALEADGKPSTGQVQYVRDRLERYIQEREFEQAVRAASGYLDEGDTDKAFEVVRAAQRVQMQADTHLVLPDDVGAFIDYFSPERLDRVSLSTGLPRLDQALGGGLRPGELGVVMAPLKRGKSMALVHLGAIALMRGISVVHYTLENGAQDTYGRYVSHLTGEAAEDLVRNRISEEDLRRRIEDTLKRVDSEAQVFIKYYPGKVTSVADLEADFEELRTDQNIGLVIVDYGDLARSRQRHERAYDEQADVFLELRNLAMKYDVPLWTATQSNRRSLETENVSMNQIAESLGKAMKADFVVALSQTPEESRMTPKRLRVNIVAARRGRGGRTVLVEARFDRAQLVEVDEGE